MKSRHSASLFHARNRVCGGHDLLIPAQLQPVYFVSPSTGLLCGFECQDLLPSDDVRRGCQVLGLPFKSLALHLAPQRSHRLVARMEPGAAKDVVAEVPRVPTAQLGLVRAGGVDAPGRRLRADLGRGGAGRRGAPSRACLGLAVDVGVAGAALALLPHWPVRVGSAQDVVQRGRVWLG